MQNNKNAVREPWRIGLTGGIGCGKSSVAEYLQAEGLRRLDTDQVARQIVQPSQPALQQISDLFGQGILKADGSLDRESLGEVVFSNPPLRKELERILHPAIWSSVESFLDECSRRNEDCVVELPLLFEKERQNAFNSVWVVSTSPEQQRERLTKRSGWTREEIQNRIESQMPLESKIQRADVVIHNLGTSEELRQEVKKAWNSLLEQKKGYS